MITHLYLRNSQEAFSRVSIQKFLPIALHVRARSHNVMYVEVQRLLIATATESSAAKDLCHLGRLKALGLDSRSQFH